MLIYIYPSVLLYFTTHFNKFSYSPQEKYNTILRPSSENEYKNFSTAQRDLRTKEHDDWGFEPNG
jgi:hypothetical protein